MRDVVRGYVELDRVLVDSGLPPTPQKWIDWLAEFEASGKPRAVVRKGRRVFASTCFAPRLGAVEMLFGGHCHVPGTPPLEYSFLSVKKDEAANRLIGIEAILEALGIERHPAGTTIEVPEYNALFRVYVVSLRTAVGGSVPWAWCDEVPHWRDDKAGANPAELVIGKFAPAMATFPNSRLWLVGSPYSTNDYHARLFNAGSDAHHQVFFGASWDINETLTEELTHRLEPDESTWRREYAAIPSDAVEDDWFSGAVKCAQRDWTEPDIRRGARPIVAIDPKFDWYTRDRFGWSVTVSLEVAGKRITYLLDKGAWIIREGETPTQLAQRVRELCQLWQPELDPDGLAIVYSDQHEGHSFSELARQAGLNIQVVPWTGGSGDDSKLARFKSVKSAMLEGAYKMEPDDDLATEFRQFQAIYSRNGYMTVRASDSQETRTRFGHCDRVTAIVLGGSIALNYRPGKPRPVSAKHEDPIETMRKKHMRMQQIKQAMAMRKDPHGELTRRILGKR